MMMSGPLLVSMAEAIRGLRSFMLIRSTVTSTPASFPNSAASRLNSTSEAGTKLTHSRMLSLVPFGKLGAFCALTRLGFGSSLTCGRIPAGHATGLEDSNDEKPEQPHGGDGVGDGRMRDDAGGHPRAGADSRRRLDAARQGTAPGASAEARSGPDLDEEQRQAGDGRHRDGGFTAAQSYRGEHRARQAPGRAKPPDPARWSTRRSPEAGRCAQGCDEVAKLRWRRLSRLRTN